MAFEAYLSIKGAKQGQFKGEGAQAKRKDKWMPVVSFTMGLKSPRDASGHATGKRQYEPITVVKEWGAASPQGLTACATNEVLQEVVIEFIMRNANGEELVSQTVKLIDATIIEVVRFTGAGQAETGPGPHHDAGEFERWSFTVRKIEVADRAGMTTFADDLTA